MKKKKIYLHIGVPKTGTTSIQSYLAKNYDDLHKDGCLVPKSSRSKKKNHTLLANYCINSKKITKMNIRNGMHTKRDLKQFNMDFYHILREEIEAFEGEVVILSSEQCYGSLSLVEEIKRLKNLFEGLYDELKIIVYIREQSEMLCSLYSTRMKGGNTYTIPSKDEFSNMELLDFNNRLRLWEQVFGLENVILRVFDADHLYKNDIVSDFCKMTNVPKYSSVMNNLNTSLNAKQCEFLRLVNRYIPLISKGRVNPVRKGLMKMVANTRIESPPVSALISRDYQEVYKQSNEELACRYFGKGMEIFTKKTLNDEAIDQRRLLTDQDRKSIAVQIIESNTGEESEVLLKCIAAIFDVSYADEKITMEYVESLAMDMCERKSWKKIKRYIPYFNKLM